MEVENGGKNYFMINPYKSYIAGLGIELGIFGSAGRHTVTCTMELIYRSTQTQNILQIKRNYYYISYQEVLTEYSKYSNIKHAISYLFGFLETSFQMSCSFCSS